MSMQIKNIYLLIHWFLLSEFLQVFLIILVTFYHEKTRCNNSPEKNTLDLILTTLPGQFKDVHFSDKLSDHDIFSGILKNFTPPPPPPPIKKPWRKVYLYQKGDYESMRKDTLEFAKEKYFNGHSKTRSVQENFDLLTSFIQDSADKPILSKTSRSVSSIPWITLEARRKIRRKNKTHAKAKKTGSSKLRSKFETLRREIKGWCKKTARFVCE